MSPNKSIRSRFYSKQVLEHLQQCPVCLSRVTAILSHILAEDASRLAQHVSAFLETSAKDVM